MKKIDTFLIVLSIAVGLALFSKVAPVVHEDFVEPMFDKILSPMSKTVFVDVEKYPARMDLGFHNPSTGFMSAASCDVAGKDPEFLMTVVTKEGVMQTYNCNHLDITDL